MLRRSELLRALAFKASISSSGDLPNTNNGMTAPPLEEFTDSRTGEVLLRPRGTKTREMPYSARDVLERVGSALPIKYYRSKTLFDIGDWPADDYLSK